MPALNQDHKIVRRALEKDGWTITHDPLTLTVGPDRVHVDLGAERVLAAERGTEKIAVEVKMFRGLSRISDLETAIGQYIVYRIALRRTEPERELYLAVPQTVLVNQFQKRALFEGFVIDERGQLLGYDADLEEIVEWMRI